MSGLKSPSQFSNPAFRDIPGQLLPSPFLAPGRSLNCSKGHQPRGECTPQTSFTSPTNQACGSCELHERLGWIFLHLGEKILPQTDSEKAKVCLREIFAAKRP